MSVGLTIIARDEEEALPILLASVEGAFDRVVLLDTGSEDATVGLFQAWAAKQSGLTYQVGHFDWIDDFAAARRAADNLLLWGTTEPDSQTIGAIAPMVDWVCWADCDDEIRGAEHIREICDQAAPECVGFLIDYDYARIGGRTVSYLRRERMVRAGCGTWDGRVHEAQHIAGGVVQPVDPALLLWVHRKADREIESGSSNERNLRILEKWLADDPTNPRVLSYLGVENAMRDRHEEACEYYNRYLELRPDWNEERAQVHRRFAVSLLALGRPGDARMVALDGLDVMPWWPDAYLTLAEVAALLGEHEKGIHYARQVIELGIPDRTLMIINPLDYTFQPRRVMAGCLAAEGRLDEAIAVAQEALQVIPDAGLHNEVQGWRRTMKRERTAETFVMCAQQLVAHDEQLKALRLLTDCVPHFATQHPKVVGMRQFIRDRLSWAFDEVDFSEHYVTGGSKPEDFVPDDMVDPICNSLPRCDFLLRGLREQLEVAA